MLVKILLLSLRYHLQFLIYHAYINLSLNWYFDFSYVRRHLKLHFILLLASQLNIFESLWNGYVVHLVDCSQGNFSVFKQSQVCQLSVI